MLSKKQLLGFTAGSRWTFCLLQVMLVAALGLLQSCTTLVVTSDGLTDTMQTRSQGALQEPSTEAASESSVPLDAATTDPGGQPGQSGQFATDTLYLLLVAELAANYGQYDLTLENYAKAATITGDIEVIARAARLARYFGKHAKALETGQLWLSKEPDNREANAIVANAWIELQQPLKALPYAEAILSLTDPEEKDASRKAAIVEAIASNSRESDRQTRQILIDRYRQLSQLYPDYSPILTGLSRLYQYQQDTDSAFQVIGQALAQNNRYLPAIIQEIRLLQASGQIDRALARLRQQLTAWPDNQRLRLLYARLLWQTDIQAAYEEFTLLSEQSPENPDIKFFRALAAIELDRQTIAETLLDELLAREYRPDTIHFYLGNLAEIDQREQEALSHYLLVTGGENYLNAHSRAARIMASQGRIDDARQHFITLRGQLPDQKPQLFVAEAAVLEMAGRHDLALAILTKAIDQYPDNIALRYNRSTLYEQSGQLELMESDLKHILDLSPENATALNALGYFLTTRTRRHREALLLIQKALALEPDDPAIIDSMGWVLFQLGQIGKAITYLRRAFDLLPDPEIAAHLGEALWVNGQQQEARRIWSKTLQANPNDHRIPDTMERLRVKP